MSIAGNEYQASRRSEDMDGTKWTVTSDSKQTDLDKQAEFYLSSYTDLAGNLQTTSTQSQTTDTEGYSVYVDTELPDSLTILSSTSISRSNSLDLTDVSGYVYPTLIDDRITFEFETDEPLSSVSVSLAGNEYQASRLSLIHI